MINDHQFPSSNSPLSHMRTHTHALSQTHTFSLTHALTRTAYTITHVLLHTSIHTHTCNHTSTNTHIHKHTHKQSAPRFHILVLMHYFNTHCIILQKCALPLYTTRAHTHARTHTRTAYTFTHAVSSVCNPHALFQLCIYPTLLQNISVHTPHTYTTAHTHTNVCACISACRLVHRTLQ